jgi:hypothetical protein
VLRAGRASTVGLSPLSTPDSFLMCYQILGAVAHTKDIPHLVSLPTTPLREAGSWLALGSVPSVSTVTDWR